MSRIRRQEGKHWPNVLTSRVSRRQLMQMSALGAAGAAAAAYVGCDDDGTGEKAVLTGPPATATASSTIPWSPTVTPTPFHLKGSAGRDRPNFIFLMADELRADAVHCIDGQPIQTPNMDRLAEQGVAFSNCFTVHSVCSPSRCSFMTGWYPHTLGHRTLYHLLRPHEPNLLKYLKSNGYFVQWNGKNDLLAEASFADSVSQRATNAAPSPLWPANPWPEDHRFFKSFYFGPRGQAGQLPYQDLDWVWIQEAIKLLQSPPAEPFMLYLPLVFPHPPYTVEEPYFSMYDRDSVRTPLPAQLNDKPHFMRELHRRMGMDRLDEADLREIVATYWGMVTRFDDLVGQLMAALDASSVRDNTVVILASDHGDYACDYGLTEKWWTGFQDCIVRVPLIALLPGERGGRRVEALTETIDVFPTIMDLAGITPHHTQFGRSLLPLILGETQEHRSAVFAEGGQVPGEQQTLETPWPKGTIYYDKTNLQHEDPTTLAKGTMIRTKRWKYVARLEGQGEELYDLEADSGELVNLAGDNKYADIVADLRDQQLQWFLATGDAVPFDKDGR
jgi:arylsulfatase A-like enzyme